MAARQFVAKSPRLAHPDNNLIQLPQPEKSKSYEIQQTLKAAKEFAEQNKKNIHLTPNMIQNSTLFAANQTRVAQKEEKNKVPQTAKIQTKLVISQNSTIPVLSKQNETKKLEPKLAATARPVDGSFSQLEGEHSESLELMDGEDTVILGVEMNESELKKKIQNQQLASESKKSKVQ